MQLEEEGGLNKVKTFLKQLNFTITRRYQRILDISTPHKLYRWLFTAFVVLVYALRAFVFIGGFYVVTYALGIYLLNLFIGFLTPKVDPETILSEIDTEEEEDDRNRTSLPTTEKSSSSSSSSDESGEFKPFIRRLPEFKFWVSTTRAFLISIFCTFFSFFDIPVFWPILLLYFIILFSATMRKQIQHMIKYKYLPWSANKPKFNR